ncbi:MAG: adenylosuccinate lyase, partial [Burkholderiaceae bacterium]|nr:adenylosuccinate lyase [Burkholderiaceae bacterium]
MTKLSQLSALSPLDGRYAKKLDALRPWLSEAAFMQQRVVVEIQWLLALSEAKLANIPSIDAADKKFLLKLAEDFSEADAERIKSIEAVTNHDVKAVEYWLKEKVAKRPKLLKASEFIHFACTSEDINNTSHGLMLRGARDQVLLPQLKNILKVLNTLAVKHAKLPMLSRTHGQP